MKVYIGDLVSVIYGALDFVDFIHRLVQSYPFILNLWLLEHESGTIVLGKRNSQTVNSSHILDRVKLRLCVYSEGVSREDFCSWSHLPIW